MELTSLYCVKQRKFLLIPRKIGHKHKIFVIYQLQYYFHKYAYIFSIEFFYIKCLKPYTISVWPNLSPSVLLSHGFVAKKQKHYCTQFCIQREPKSLCSWKTVALHSADSGEVPHTESRRWLHDLSHSVPTLTVTVLSARSVEYSLTQTHTQHISYSDSWTAIFPLPCSSHTHFCT